MKRIKTLLLLFSISICVQAQEVLTIEQAISIAFENNFDIQIIKNNSYVSKNNNSTGNAGMLPTLDLNGGYSESTTNLKQKFYTGSEVNRDASGSKNYSMDLALNWVVFDGMKMFFTKDKLSKMSAYSEKQLKIHMENTMEEIISVYYSIIRNNQLVSAMEQEFNFSKTRLTITDKKLQNGAGSKYESLQAKADYNRQKSILLSAKSDAQSAKIKLNQLLARPLTTEFIPTDTVIINYHPDINELNSQISENLSIGLYELNQNISELSLKETKTLRSPKVSLNSHYFQNKVTSDAGFTLLNQNSGYTFGITATLPIFHGFNTNKQISNAKIDLINARLELQRIKSAVNENLLNAFREFITQKEILDLEEANILIAQELYSIAQERYKIGTISQPELQDVQRLFEEGLLRLVDARYTTKIKETSLKKVANQLIFAK